LLFRLDHLGFKQGFSFDLKDPRSRNMNAETAEDREVSKEKLVAELHAVVQNAEELLKATADQTGEKVSTARARIQDSLNTARMRLSMAQVAIADKTKQAARATDELVRENPWKAVGVAAAFGFLVGLVVRRH
jgi:ElaB/YqjD/DUF883 family membrane-anchored ribosome-binding protein